MERSISGGILINKFMLVVHLCMIFISIVDFIVLFCPSGLHIFLAFLIEIFILLFRNLTFFYLLIFFLAVALARRFYKTGIYDLAFMSYEIMFFKKVFKQIK